MAKILLVEDDLELAESVEEWLGAQKYTVELVTHGREALDRLRLYQYDLIILDWGLPDVSGVDVCQQYRSAGGTNPVLMLTGKKEISEKETGLDAGADDYLTKPFHLKELSARLRALLRRPASVVASVLKAGNLTLEPASHRVKKGDQEIELRPKEFALLEFFMRNPGEVFSQEALLNRVWSAESDTSPDIVYTYIKTLRKKISPEAPTSIIKTVHNKGYKLTSS